MKCKWSGVSHKSAGLEYALPQDINARLLGAVCHAVLQEHIPDKWRVEILHQCQHVEGQACNEQLPQSAVPMTGVRGRSLRNCLRRGLHVGVYTWEDLRDIETLCCKCDKG